MPKNWNYSGLVRAPSTMAWLIGRRARTKGRLDPPPPRQKRAQAKTWFLCTIGVPTGCRMQFSKFAPMSSSVQPAARRTDKLLSSESPDRYRSAPNVVKIEQRPVLGSLKPLVTASDREMTLARRRKADAASVVLVVAVALLGLLALVPKAVWFGIAGAAAAWVLYKMFGGAKKLPAAEVAYEEQPTKLAAVASTVGRSVPLQPESGLVQPRQRTTFDDPISVAPFKAPKATEAFRVPAAPKGFGAGTWIPRGSPVEIAGLTLPEGMIYVGTSLKTPGGSNDPCLIDPSKQVSPSGDYTERQMGYWPSYSEISGSARRSYLNWLAGGRSDPDADVGYVFLFFYGLERRAIVDAAIDSVAQADWPAIADELRRLLALYGEKSGSFRGYATELLNWVSMSSRSEKLYEEPVPALLKTYELPLYLRRALGQATLDGVPVPVNLALAWVKLDPKSYLRTPATRCEAQFDALFAAHYAKATGAGMVIPKNRTKLKFVYRPASAGFRGFNEIKLTFGETPDVTVLSAPIKKLRDIAEVATKELEPYSRFVGKNPEGRNALEGLLNLPATLWPESVQKALRDIEARVGDVPLEMSFQELLATLGAKTTFTKDKTQTLARALESMSLGMEPDVLGGSKTPKPEDRVILFSTLASESTSRATPSYQAAMLTLQLASSVVMADGDFGADEMAHLRTQVQSWVHLTPAHQQRLSAHLQLLMAAPVPLSSLKKRLDALPAAAKESIASFMATVAQSDGTVSPAEVKMLEKVYKVFGLDPKKVFSDIHAVSAGAALGSTLTNAKVAETGFKLDPARIAALQQDTARVSALLANIFNEEDSFTGSEPVPATEVDVELDDEATHADAPAGLLSLDETHSSLARMLLSRPQWSRAELLDVAADLDLMLDGALEHINEAAFDAHDIPFTEGDDPIDVNAEVREKIEA